MKVHYSRHGTRKRRSHFRRHTSGKLSVLNPTLSREEREYRRNQKGPAIDVVGIIAAAWPSFGRMMGRGS